MGSLQMLFLDSLFKKNPLRQKAVTVQKAPSELEEQAVLELEQKFPVRGMSTIDAVNYCRARFGVPCSEHTLVSGKKVRGGVVSKVGVLDYVIWYKKQNSGHFRRKYKFKYVDEYGKVHENGYKP